MRRTQAGILTDFGTRLAELERGNPEWRSWLRLVQETARWLDDPAWEAPLAGAPVTAALPGAPLLHGRGLRVDAGRLRSFLRQLADTAARHAPTDSGAASLARYRPSAADALALLQATVRQDVPGIDGLATAAGVDGAALGTLALLAALPPLVASAHQVRHELPSHWPHGYCPICGAWPVLAELRGLERARRLRCGRCGGDWQLQWLCCPYCGEADHARLGALRLEGEPDSRKVESCASCQGYLKAVTTLQEIPPVELLLLDLETVELDLVAAERGYVRPDRPGYPVALGILPRN